MPEFTDYVSFANAPVWDDMIGVQPTADAAGGGAPANINFGPSGTIRALAFVINDSISGQVQFSHRYKEGTDIEPHVHWTPVNTNTGNVLWSLDYYWLNNGETATGAPTNIQIQQAAGGVAWTAQIADFPTVVGTGKLVSSIFMFRLARITSGAPAYNANPALISFDIHFQVDSNGSRQEFIK